MTKKKYYTPIWMEGKISREVTFGESQGTNGYESPFHLADDIEEPLRILIEANASDEELAEMDNNPKNLIITKAEFDAWYEANDRPWD